MIGARWFAFGALALLGGCAKAPAPPPPCPAEAVLAPVPPTRGTPVEATPGGQCVAARAEAGDVAAALRLGDFYRTLPGTLPLIDRRGRQLHWYRIAANHGSPRGAWAAVQLIDVERGIQVPNDALAYLIVAIKAGIPQADDYLIQQWQDGRVDPGKLWGLRRWLDQPGALSAERRAEIIAGLDLPHDPLEEE